MAATNAQERDNLEISIKGTGTVIRPAERAIVSIKAESNHESTPQAASAAITAAATKIREMINDNMLHDENNKIHPESSIAHWSMSRLETKKHFSGPSYDAQGHLRRDEKTHFTAHAAFEVKFKDFGVLNTLATKWSAMDNVTISNISWALTDATEIAIQGTARRLAAEDAVARACDYASAFVGAKREQVKPFFMSENHYYGHSTRPHLHRGKGERSVRAAEEELQFEPEDVRMEAKVDVKFSVDY